MATTINLEEIDAREPRSLTMGGNGNRVVQTRLTDAEALTICDQSRLSFARSLAAQGQAGQRPLTPNQVAWTHVVANEELARRRKDAALNVQDSGEVFHEIVALFGRAADRLKFPRIEFPAEGDQVIRLALVRRGPHTGSIDITDGGKWGMRRWFGRIGPDGRAAFAKGVPPRLVATLAVLNDDPARFLGEQGRLHDRCCFCLQQLTDARSVMAGYGETCSRHYQIPYPTKTEAKTRHAEVVATVATD